MMEDRKGLATPGGPSGLPQTSMISRGLLARWRSTTDLLPPSDPTNLGA